MKKIIIIGLLAISLLFLVACDTNDAEPDPELESQLAELSDEELVELGETVSKESDAAVAGQAIRSRYGSKISVRRYLSKKEMGLIIGEQSRRMKKETQVQQRMKKETQVQQIPTIPTTNFKTCEGTKDEGESCMKHCECTTGICGYDQPIGEDGMPNGPGRTVCETPNDEGKSCFEDIECKRELNCELDGPFIVRGTNRNGFDVDYDSWAEFLASGDQFVTSKVAICQ